MISIRRLYIYLVCAVSLLAATTALIGLVRDVIPPGISAAPTTTALQIAIIVISLPFFLLHWFWAQRLAGREPDERTNAVRGFYLFGMLAIFLGSLVANALDLVAAFLQLVLRISPERPLFGLPAPTPLETLINAALAMIVYALLWFYHELTIREDVKSAQEDPWMGIRHIYLYAFCAAGITLAAVGASQILRWVLYQLGGASGGNPVSLAALTYEFARLVIGAALWLVFWTWAQRRFKSGAEQERGSVTRKIYLYGVVFVSALVAVSAATMTLSGILQSLFGIPPEGDIRDALSIIIVLAVVWAYHSLMLRQDVQVILEEPRQATVRRVYLYLVAAIGLGAFLIGLSGIVSVLIRSAGGEFFGEGLKVQLAWFIAALIAGLPVWILPWRRAQSAAAAPTPRGTEERRSFVRRLYLFGYLFIATMTVLGSAIYILFRILSLILGERNTGDLFADLGQPIAFMLIAIGVWLYHGMILRQDGQILESEKAARRAEFHVAVVDADNGQFGRALLDTLQRELPGLSLIPIGLTSAAGTAMNAGASDKTPVSRLAAATLIVGPWTMQLPGSGSGAVTADFAAAVQSSPARRLLVPTRGESWDWIGVQESDPAKLAKQTANAIRQVIEGEELRSGSSLHPAVIIVLALVGLCALLFIVSSLISFFGSRF